MSSTPPTGEGTAYYSKPGEGPTLVTIALVLLLVGSLLVNAVLTAVILLPKLQPKPARNMHPTTWDAQGRKLATWDYTAGRSFATHSQHFRPDGTLRTEFFDVQGTGRPERAIGYSRDGTRKTVWDDADQNGVYETTTVYLNGNKTLVEKDLDQDETPETFDVWNAGKVTATWYDFNQDGRYDAGKAFDASGAVRAEVDDLDADGFPDVAKCTADGAAAPKELNLTTCR